MREVVEVDAEQIKNGPAREGTYRFLTTGDVDGFRAMGMVRFRSSRSRTSSTWTGTLEAAVI